MNIPAIEEIKEKMSKKIILPKEFDLFYEWSKKQKNNVISGCFEWRSDYYDAIEGWVGSELKDRFGMFGAGSTGNIYTFWLDDTGKQKIVHIGSEGESLLILGNNFLDFLKYLSIGYDDPPSDHEFDKSVEEYFTDTYFPTGREREQFKQSVNPHFQKWVKKTFKTNLPLRGSEIVNVKDKSFENWLIEAIKNWV